MQGPLRLSGSVDADWGGSDDAKSTTGYIFYLGKSLISWASKAQPTVATSSTHAEYVAAYQATAECLWLRAFLSDLGLLDSSHPTSLQCDNQPAINLASYHMVTTRSKHFDTKFHFIREQLANGSLSLVFCPGKDNCADMFTKPVPKDRFLCFRDQLGLRSPETVANMSNSSPLVPLCAPLPDTLQPNGSFLSPHVGVPCTLQKTPRS